MILYCECERCVDNENGMCLRDKLTLNKQGECVEMWVRKDSLELLEEK